MLGNEGNRDVLAAAVDPGAEGSFDDQVNDVGTLGLGFFSIGTGCNADDDSAFARFLTIGVLNIDAEGASDVGGA